MARCFTSTWLLAILVTAWFIPFVTSDQDWQKDEKYQWAVDHLPGFDWTGAFKGTPGDYTNAQARILAEALKMAVLSVLALAKHGKKIDNNLAWSVFFMNDNQADWGHGWTTRGPVSILHFH